MKRLLTLCVLGIACQPEVTQPPAPQIDNRYRRTEVPMPFASWNGEVALSGDGKRLIALEPRKAVVIFVSGEQGWQQEEQIPTSAARIAQVQLSGSGDVLALATEDMAAKPAIKVLRRGAMGWAVEATVRPVVGEVSDDFGAAFALSGTGERLVVGAPLEDSSGKAVNASPNDNLATNSGAAYVFTKTQAGWEQTAFLKASNADPEDRFGSVIDLDESGSSVAISALGESSSLRDSPLDNRSPSSGAVYIYRLEAGAWAESAYLKSPSPNTFGTNNPVLFGRALVLSDDGASLVVSERGNSSLSPRPRWFARSATGWRSNIDIINLGPYSRVEDSHGTEFGLRLAFSGDGKTLLASDAIWGHQSSGMVVALRFGDISWVPQANFQGTAVVPQARFGSSISIDKAGVTIAVGALAGSPRAHVISCPAGIGKCDKEAVLVDDMPPGAGTAGGGTAMSGGGAGGSGAVGGGTAGAGGTNPIVWKDTWKYTLSDKAVEERLALVSAQPTTLRFRIQYRVNSNSLAYCSICNGYHVHGRAGNYEYRVNFPAGFTLGQVYELPVELTTPPDPNVAWNSTTMRVMSNGSDVVIPYPCVDDNDTSPGSVDRCDTPSWATSNRFTATNNAPLP